MADEKDRFGETLKLLERAIPADHEVADDQQRPAISQDLQRETDWASRSVYGRWLRQLRQHHSKSYLQLASESGGQEGLSGRSGSVSAFLACGREI